MQISTFLNKLVAVVAVVALGIGLLLPAQALAQGGDSCAVATVVGALPYTNNGTTTGMTHNYDATCAAVQGTNGAPDVVYSYTASTSTNIEISLCSGNTDYDTKLWVYEDTCLTASEVACNDDACTAPLFGNNPFISSLLMAVDSGHTYYIVIGGYSATDDGAYTVTITEVPCPEPSGFALDSVGDNAAIISWASVNIGDSYTLEYGLAGFVPGTGTTITNPIVSNPTTVTLSPLVEGTNYEFYVLHTCDSVDTDTSATLAFITTAPPPANDLCSGAILVPTCDTLMRGSTRFATTDNATTTAACGAGGIDTSGVWYYMVGVDTAMTVSTCDSANFDTRISVYSGSCANLSCVAGNDDGTGCAGFTSELTFTMVAGQDYYFLIHGFPGGPAPRKGEFTVSFTCSAPCSPQPANDDCAGATALTLSATGEGTPTAGTTFCATPALENPDCDAFGVIADVWFSFNTGDATSASFDLSLGTASAINFAVYDGCGTTAGLCEEDVTGPFAVNGLSANTTYQIQVWNGGAAEAGTFNITLESDDIVGIGTALGAADAKLFPNPANDQVTINLTGNGSESSLTIFNLHGQQVYAQRYGRGQTKITEKLNVSEYAKGVYVVRFQSDDSQVTRKLVIE